MRRPNVRGAAFLAPLAALLLAAALATSAGPAGAAGGDDLSCTILQDDDGSHFAALNLIDTQAFPLHLRRTTPNGSRWVSTVTKAEFDDGIGFDDLPNDTGYFVRYREGGVQDVNCFAGDRPVAPRCSVEAWSVGSDFFWSIVVESQDEFSDFTLFINGTEHSANSVPVVDPAGNENVFFTIARFATPEKKFEVAPSAALARRTICGSVQQDQERPGQCDALTSDDDPAKVWIEIDVDFPVSFTVLRDGVAIGEPTPVKFADFPGDYLVPNDFYEVVGAINDEYTLRFGGIGLVCTGILPPPPPDGFVCTRDGSSLSWTEQAADGGRYHVRRLVGSSTKWEQTVTSLSATVLVPDGHYFIRWRENGNVRSRGCQ